MCNARLKPEYKVQRGDVCPVCRIEYLDHEQEVDDARCFNCSEDLAGFQHSCFELRTILKEAM